MHSLGVRQQEAVAAATPNEPMLGAVFDTAAGGIVVARGPGAGCGRCRLERYALPRQSDPHAGEHIGSIECHQHNRAIAGLNAQAGRVCVVFEDGDIAAVGESEFGADAKGPGNLDPTGAAPSFADDAVVGTVDEGILAAAWAPDEQVLVLATAADTLIFMTSEFDELATVALRPEDVTPSGSQVSVGWGRAETQFRGKRAKDSHAPRDPTLPERVDEGHVGEHDDGRVLVSWRGDGEYVAVSRIEQLASGKRRSVRVYTRTGALDSVSEPVDGQEGVFAYAPNGSLISCVRRHEGEARVMFFERNGLRHGDEFVVGAERVSSMCWSADSRLLALVVHVGAHCLCQVWTRTNYHWYLKQQLQLDDTEVGARAVFHPERPDLLCLVSQTRVQTLTFTQPVYAQPPGRSAGEDRGLVAVVDGTKLLLTPLAEANVPPPMSLAAVDVGVVPRTVAVGPGGRYIAAVGVDSVYVVEWASSDGDPVVTQVIRYPGGDSALRAAAFASEHTLILSTGSGVGSPDGVLMRVDIQSASVTAVPSIVTAVKMMTAVVGMPGHVVVVATGNVLISVDTQGECRELGSSTHDVTAVEACAVDGEIVVVYTTAQGRLWANERLLSTSCTSFVVAPEYLVFTTAQSLAKVVWLRAPVETMHVPHDEDVRHLDEQVRSVERGSRLVMTCPTRRNVIMQQARGNLETVYPRALVLSGVREHVRKMEYRDAFAACRLHRIDMNILYDYEPVQFSSHVDHFIRQLGSTDDLDLFISSLKPENVCVTRYKEGEAAASAGEEVQRQGPPAFPHAKVNEVCDRVRDALQSSFAATHLKSIITCYMCKSPPELADALSVIAALRDDKHAVDEAVEHICYLGDINLLYREALGLYDLPLAVLIAQKSPLMDPKEYVPKLKELEQLSTLERRFRIDDELDRFGKAMLALHEMRAPDRVVEYATLHDLFSEALGFYRFGTAERGRVMQAYAHALQAQLKYHEAAYAYECVGELTMAMNAYAAAGEWSPALSLALRLELPHQDVVSMATTLAEAQVEHHHYLDAASIYRDYLDDSRSAASCLCQAGRFDQAETLVRVKGRADLYASVVVAAAVDAFADASETLSEMAQQIASQLRRLDALGEIKAQDPEAWEQVDDDSDTMSIASSNVSTVNTAFTRYTGLSGTTTNTKRATARNKRREERKRIRGRQGTVYEEQYLHASLTRLAVRFCEESERIQGIVDALIRAGDLVRAKQLQRLTISVQKAVREQVMPVVDVGIEVKDWQPVPALISDD